MHTCKNCYVRMPDTINKLCDVCYSFRCCGGNDGAGDGSGGPYDHTADCPKYALRETHQELYDLLEVVDRLLVQTKLSRVGETIHTRIKDALSKHKTMFGAE